MRRILVIVISLILMPLINPGAAEIEMDFLVNPESLSVDKNNLYITEDARVYIVSKETYQVKNMFGKPGEGPREFLITSNRRGYRLGIDIGPDFILVNTLGKVSFFTPSGEYIKEMKTMDGAYFKALDGSFVGYKLVEATEANKTIFISFNIYDDDFKIKHEVFRKKALWQLGKQFNPIYYGMGNLRGVLFQVYRNRIYIEGPDNTIHVFDSSGQKCAALSLKMAKRQVSSEERKRILQVLKETRAPRIFEIVKSLANFPDYFPLKYFTVSDDLIYVLSFERKSAMSKIYIYDLNGKFIRSLWIPFSELNILHYEPYAIRDKKFYQLVENPDSDGWMLKVNDMEFQPK